MWRGKKCVLCGGHRDAEGLEHAPPKVMFHDKHRGRGLEVPACKRCNTGSAGVDQIAAFLTLSQSEETVLSKRAMTEFEHRVTRGVANNVRRIYVVGEQVPVVSADGEVVSHAYRVELAPEVAKQVMGWAVKQTLAIWFRKCGRIVSHRATIFVELLTSARPPSEELAAIIRSLGPNYTLEPMGKTFSKQFFYKIQTDPAHQKGLVFAQYHGGFAFVSVVNDTHGAKLSRKCRGRVFGTNAHRGIHLLE